MGPDGAQSDSRRRVRARWTALTALVALSCGGCEPLLGNPFDVDRGSVEVAPDGGEDGGALDSSLPDAGLDAAVIHRALDDCNPEHAAANGVIYPSVSSGEVVLNDAMIDTSLDGGTLCSPLDVKHCVIVGNTLRIGRVNVWGSRPLVFVAAHDLVVEGDMNASGGEGPSLDHTGPGDHAVAAAPSVSGGGGNAEEGGRSMCGSEGGRLLLARHGLVGGGDGFSLGACGRGGRGGGAVQLTSLCGAVIVNKFIAANGGSGFAGGEGADTSCPDGAGGGAGGTIWIQARRGLRFGGEGFIELKGGGGGGGSCRTSGGVLVPGTSTGWHEGAKNPGTKPEPQLGGAGGRCEASGEGGAGGAGGAGQVLPMPGGAPRLGASSSMSTCGGGGGARGRLVLDGDLTCALAERNLSGKCVRASED